MKKLTTIIALFLSTTTIFAQYDEPCLPDGITFTNQQQIDNFQTDYPDCTKIGGDVEITRSNITSLQGLNVLTKIGGSLTITDNDLLTDLTGLENLTSIGKNFSLCHMHGSVWGSPPYYTGNLLLTSLNGLNNLKSIGGDFEVIANPSLVDFSGLEKLDSIHGNLVIGHPYGEYNGGLGEYNNGIVSLEGLDDLAYIGGNLSIIYNDSLTNCEALSICNYLSNPNSTVEIHHNATGCDNPAEIAEGCGITLPCLPFGNYYFFSQDDIDNFQTEYPGCSSLNGDVFINGGDVFINGNDITNLNGLMTVTSIDGDLEIPETKVLQNLEGLNNLSIIGGDLIIGGISGDEGNPQLTSIEALNNLQSIEGILKIESNDNLPNLNGLENLSNIGGLLFIQYNDALENIYALSQIDTLSWLKIYANKSLESLSSLSSLTQVGVVSISYNHSLVNLEGLQNLDTVVYLTISNNNSLSHINELENISYIDGRLEIAGNNSLNDLSGLSGLKSVSGSVWIDDNDLLTSLSGLENLESIGEYLSIDNNVSLTSLSGLDNLTSIGVTLRIKNNDDLTSLSELDNLTSVGKSLDIRNNTSLTSLSGLDNLTSIGGSLFITSNPLLSNCEAEGICTYLSDPNEVIEISNNAEGCTSIIEVAVACGAAIPCFEEGEYWLHSQFDVDHFPEVFPGCNNLMGDVYIIGDGIFNLDSLAAITSIQGDFFIYTNGLTTLHGLENLEQIAHDLFIGNTELQNLSGLENLDTIEGSLLIGYLPDYDMAAPNDFLTSLVGFDKLIYIGNSLFIANNKNLSSCAVQPICAYLSVPNGQIAIHDNAPGCDSKVEVQHACWLITIENENVLQNQIIFYPNPVTANAKLSGEFTSSKTINICIYSTTGLCLKSWEFKNQQSGKQEFNLNLDGLPRGIYFLRLQAGNEVVLKKVVKL